MNKKYLTCIMAVTFLFGGILFSPYFAGAQSQYVSGEILVKFQPGVCETEINAMNEFYGVEIIEYLEKLDVYHLRIPAEKTVEQMIDWYSNDPSVQYAEPNYMGRGGDFTPNDTGFDSQWHLNNTGQTGGTPDADIDAVEGWQITRGSSSVVVAVLDTGIDFSDPEFQGRILPGFDFVNDDNDPSADPWTGHEIHGLLVSGILAGNADNSFGTAGIDHNVKILPVKVLDSNKEGTTVVLALGLIYAADQKAHVINMSLVDYPLDSPTLNYALQFARDSGAVLIAGAGNNGIGDADVSGPGASPLTISVGATDHNDARLSYPAVASGTGSALDVVAPGEEVITWHSYFFTGTSAAAPVVSGIATLMLSIDPSLTHDEIRDILIQTAEDQVGPPSEDTPGRDDFFGHGRVNMNAALTEVSGNGNQPPVAYIDSIRPNPANKGTNIVFIGHGTDPDLFDWPRSYHWTSDIDGDLSNRRFFMRRDLSVGTHIITLKVADSNGLWSDPVTQTLIVNSGPENQPPVAYINSIRPNPAKKGYPVMFMGRGTDPDRFDWLRSYHWTSDKDGVLSNRSFFMKRDLSVGTHIITLRVADSKWLWSNPVSQTLIVNP